MTFYGQSNLSKLTMAEPLDSDFNFVAAGDWGCDNNARKTFTMMKNMEPELYLTLGDYSYESTLDCWYDIVKSAGSAMKVVVGNHDTEGSVLPSLMSKFNLDKQYYSFDHQNTHFLGLSSELNSGEDKGQFEFAKADLAKAKSNPNTDWIIVYLHRPFYSGSGADNIGMRDMYHPLFQKYNVDLVLAGHAHNYERSYPLNYNDVRPARPLLVNHAPGNGAAIGGIKVVSDGGWFAARPSGTENVYKIYGESFRSAEHLKSVLDQAQQIVDAALTGE